MKTTFKPVIAIFMLALVSCGIVKISFKPSPSGSNHQCAQCQNQPHSGLNRDLRYGYYYDTTERKCKLATYSTGEGCIPPPFKTLEECKACCGN
jgi:hypothetical protein